LDNINTIPPRIIVDEHFIFFLEENKISGKYLDILSKVHRNSLIYPWEHNLLLDESFKRIKDVNKKLKFAIVGAFHPIPLWDNDGLHTSIIKLAISLSDKKPFEVVILTDEKNIGKYLNNKHYSEYAALKDVIKIYCGQDALNFLDRISISKATEEHS